MPIVSAPPRQQELRSDWAFFLMIDGVIGESQALPHPGAIELTDVTLAGHNPVRIEGQGMSAGIVEIGGFLIHKPLDKSTSALMKLMITGNHAPGAYLYCCKNTGATTPQDFVIIQLTNVFVSSYETVLSAEMGGRPQDTFTLNFQIITFTYKIQQANGTLATGGTYTYNLVTRMSS